MKGRLIVLGLGAFLLLGISALVALMGVQTSGPPAFLPRGTTPADLPDPGSRGAALTARYCSSCHSVPLPSYHLADDWEPVIVDMGARRMSRVMAPLPQPTSTEHRELVAYFKRHARQPHVPAAVDAAASPDGNTKMETTESGEQEGPAL